MRQFLTLVRKESLQLLRDKVTLSIGLFLPVFLLFLFGYGLSMDIGNIRVGIVDGARTEATRAVTHAIEGSTWMEAVPLSGRAQAEELIARHRIDALLEFPADFGRTGEAGLAVSGVDGTLARSVRSYVAGAAQTALQREAQNRNIAASAGTYEVIPRAWFNEVNRSAWYLVPGLMVIVSTLVGAFLTSLTVAREWERGTMEMLLASPVSLPAFLTAKMVPYFFLGVAALSLVLGTALFVFEVPVRGSLPVLCAAAMLYFCVCLAIGLTISSVTKRQFLACQVSVILSFLPAVMLSGFLFDLRSVPEAISLIGRLLPPTYCIEILRIEFLSGGSGDIVLRDMGVLLLWLVGLSAVGLRHLKRELPRETES